MIVLIIGPPASGKGTQAKKISEEFGLKHVSTGDLFRNSKDEEVMRLMKNGILLPDEMVSEVLFEEIEDEDDIILDGYPRNISQAKTLDEFLEKVGRHVDYVVYLNTSEKELIKRISSRRVCLKCGRSYNLITNPPKVKGKCVCGGDLVQRNDETEEVVKERLKIFSKQTKPILEHYKDKVIEIDGDKSIDEISEEIYEALNQ